MTTMTTMTTTMTTGAAPSTPLQPFTFSDGLTLGQAPHGAVTNRLQAAEAAQQQAAQQEAARQEAARQQQAAQQAALEGAMAEWDGGCGLGYSLPVAPAPMRTDRVGQRTDPYARPRPRSVQPTPAGEARFKLMVENQTDAWKEKQRRRMEDLRMHGMQGS